MGKSKEKNNSEKKHVEKILSKILEKTFQMENELLAIIA